MYTKNQECILYITRFNGSEEYEITKSTWNIYEDSGIVNFCIHIDSKKALKQNDDLA